MESNKNYIFDANLMVVNREFNTIENRETGEVTEYYTCSITDGNKLFSVTGGMNSILKDLELFKFLHLGFDVNDKRQIKLVALIE